MVGYRCGSPIHLWESSLTTTYFSRFSVRMPSITAPFSRTQSGFHGSFFGCHYFSNIYNEWRLCFDVNSTHPHAPEDKSIREYKYA